MFRCEFNKVGYSEGVEAQITGLKVSLLELVDCIGFRKRLDVSGEMDLSIFGEDGTRSAVVVDTSVIMIAFVCGFCKSDTDIYPCRVSCVEDTLRILSCSDITMLEEGLEFRFIGQEITWEEGCESTLRKQYDPRALFSSIVKKTKQSIHCR
jgi:hypothetical protein